MYIPLYKTCRIYLLLLILFFNGGKKGDSTTPTRPLDVTLSFTVNDVYNGTLKYTDVTIKPVIKISLSDAINSATITNGIKLTDPAGTIVAITTSLSDGDKNISVTPQNSLAGFTTYILIISNALQTPSGGRLINPVTINLVTGLDNTDKFPQLTDEELLTLVQKQTFNYFWDMGHPSSGLALERNTSGNTVTTGGSGFGIMAIVVGISRSFVSRAAGLTRLQKIVDFLKTKAVRFHGAYPHWLDGSVGAVIPFSTKDNGGDLVETSYLVQGLITARQYFNGADAGETGLRNDINAICNGVEWDWYRQNNANTLFWHWSPVYNWEINVPIKGWNEALITYVMAASSTTHAVPKSVYDNGWAANGGIKNGSSYYGVQLPLGPANGGPLFFEHYSFLGINPVGLSDTYANYETQTKAHTLINYNYCVANPLQQIGYSDKCWGLTASDTYTGYSTSSPTNDIGVIAPTAALSSFPYTPVESMNALKFFYYKLGDKIWKDYGFTDAFALGQPWFATSTLAIDQGPIIIMIENHRTKLLWNLFMSAPEVKVGMKNLGFVSPNL